MFLLRFLSQSLFTIICCFSVRVDDCLVHLNQLCLLGPVAVIVSPFMVLSITLSFK